MADSSIPFAPNPSVAMPSRSKDEEEKDALVIGASDGKNNSFVFLSLLMLEEMMKTSWRKLEALSIYYFRRSGNKESSSHPPLTEEKKKKKEEEEGRRRRIHRRHSLPLTFTCSSGSSFSCFSFSTPPSFPSAAAALYPPSSTIPSCITKPAQTRVVRGCTPHSQTTPTFSKTKNRIPFSWPSLPSSSSFLHANNIHSSTSSSFENSNNKNNRHCTHKNEKVSEREGKVGSRSTGNTSNTNTNMLKPPTESNVLYPKEIHHITDLSIHVRRLEEAYENLLCIHRNYMKSLSMLNQNPHPQRHNKEEKKWRNKMGKSLVEVHHAAPSRVPPLFLAITDTTRIREGEGERGMQRRRKGADGHPSYVTHREVTLLRASLEATKCISQQWMRIFTSAKVEYTSDSNCKVGLGEGAASEGVEEKQAKEKKVVLGVGPSEVVEEGKIPPGERGEYKRKRRETVRQPSVLSTLSRSSPPLPSFAWTSLAQSVRVALLHIEAMAAELEDEVGDPMRTPIMGPTVDVELPSLSDSCRCERNKQDDEEEETWKKRVQSLLKNCWRIRKRVGEGGSGGLEGKHLDHRKVEESDKDGHMPTTEQKHMSRVNPLHPHHHHHETEEKKKKEETKKGTAVITNPLSQSKAHSYGSSICVNASTRSTFGFSLPNSFIAFCPSYWRMLVDTPWESRLEALTVGFFNFFVCCPLCVLISILLLLFASWWVKGFILTYVVYIFSPLGKPKFPVHPWRWYQSLAMWRYFRDYFPVRQIIPPDVQQQFDPSKTYLFGYHPHAVHAFGAVATFGGEANGISSTLPGLEFHLQTLRINFFIPFWRELCLFIGLGDASSGSIRQTLRSGPGQCVVLAIGGAEESILSRPRTNDLVLRKRKGFVKMALETGSPLVPVYGFGENNSYEPLPCVDHPTYFRLERLIKRYTTLTLPGIAGTGPFRVRPLPRPIFVVFGPPIEVPEIPFPTSEDIAFYHQKYMDRLLALYNEYCGVYDVGCRGIRFLE